MNLKNNYLTKITGVLFLIIAATLGVHEGRSLDAYKDSAGIVTICDGDTLNVQMGDKATPAQCDERLRQAVAKHAGGLKGLPEGLPDVVVLGSFDAAYNIGEYGFLSSTTYKHLLLRDYEAAGAAILKFKYLTITENGKHVKYDCSQLVKGAPNKVCYGLWLRRQWEAKAIGNKFSTVQEALAALPH